MKHTPPPLQEERASRAAQLSRRNLNDFQRIEIAHKCEDAVKAKAEERRLATLKQNQQGNTDVPNLAHREEVEQLGKKSRDELAEMAGVGHTTYEHATEVLDKAPEPVVEAARNKELSINVIRTDKIATGGECEKFHKAERAETSIKFNVISPIIKSCCHFSKLPLRIYIKLSERQK